MDRELAYAFISGAAGDLRRRGFQVILPEWWEDDHASVKMRMGLNKRNGSAYDRAPLLGVNELVAFRWELSLGEHQLTPDEFAALASGKHPLVFHQGQWFRLDLKALNKSLAFLQRHGLEGEVSMARALKLESELRQEAAGLDVEMRLQEFFAAAEKLRQADSQITPIAAPPGFLGTLRPYQERGLSWLIFIKSMGFGACLADDMGLGKTVQLIALLVYERECLPPEEVVTEPSLIICPMSVVGNWVKEFSRFSPQLKIMVHHGSDRESAEDFARSARAHHVVITTYNLVVRDLTSFLRLRWDKLILDEA